MVTFRDVLLCVYVCEFFFAAYLRPSRELLEYYRKKIAEFDTEHDEMVQKLDVYKMTYEEQVIHRLLVFKNLINA